MNTKKTSGLRYFEDLTIGELIQLGKVTVTKAMIFEFAREFDPLPFHLDENAAKASLLGGLASSGWQTAALSLKMLGDVFLTKVMSAGGLGFSNLRWRKPVMAGDTITGTVIISALRRTNSHHDWGVATFDFDIRNQKDQTVMTMSLANLIELRDPDAATMDALQ